MRTAADCERARVEMAMTLLRFAANLAVTLAHERGFTLGQAHSIAMGALWRAACEGAADIAANDQCRFVERFGEDLCD